MKPRRHFAGVRGLEEQFQRLLLVVPCLADRFTLTGDVQLRAQRHVAAALAFDDGGELVRRRHDVRLQVEEQTSLAAALFGERPVRACCSLRADPDLVVQRNRGRPGCRHTPSLGSVLVNSSQPLGVGLPT